MGLKIGSLNISSIKVGSLGIDKIYQGTNVLYESTPPIQINYIAKVADDTITNSDLELAFSSDLTTMPRGFLANCTNITVAYIPSGVTSYSACYDRTYNRITTIKCMATTPPTLTGSTQTTPTFAFYFGTAVTKIQIPSGTLSAYQSAPLWSTFSGTWEEI